MSMWFWKELQDFNMYLVTVCMHVCQTYRMKISNSIFMLFVCFCIMSGRVSPLWGVKVCFDLVFASWKPVLPTNLVINMMNFSVHFKVSAPLTECYWNILKCISFQTWSHPWFLLSGVLHSSLYHLWIMISHYSFHQLDWFCRNRYMTCSPSSHLS